MKGGSITLHPVAVPGATANATGKPASAEVKEDGTFMLSTYGTEDGAVVGQHAVTYTPIYQFID